jgi:hypothetical protein
VAGDTIVFTCASNDLRFMDSVILRQDQVPSFRRVGAVAGIVGLVVGFTPNCLSVASIEGRLVLVNGSHRAYALREMGLTHAPAVVQCVSRRDELPILGASPLTAAPDDYLRAPRPPMLKDFFDERLRAIVNVPRVIRQIKVVFAHDTMDLAGA